MLSKLGANFTEGKFDYIKYEIDDEYLWAMLNITKAIEEGKNECDIKISKKYNKEVIDLILKEDFISISIKEIINKKDKYHYKLTLNNMDCDFKLDDILNGFVIQTRNNKRFIILDGILLDKELLGHLELKDIYNDEFEVSENYISKFNEYKESINFKNMDIMKIFSSYLCLLADDCDGNFLVWERR